MIMAAMLMVVWSCLMVVVGGEKLVRYNYESCHREIRSEWRMPINCYQLLYWHDQFDHCLQVDWRTRAVVLSDGACTEQHERWEISQLSATHHMENNLIEHTQMFKTVMLRHRPNAAAANAGVTKPLCLEPSDDERDIVLRECSKVDHQQLRAKLKQEWRFNFFNFRTAKKNCLHIDRTAKKLVLRPCDRQNPDQKMIFYHAPTIPRNLDNCLIHSSVWSENQKLQVITNCYRYKEQGFWSFNRSSGMISSQLGKVCISAPKRGEVGHAYSSSICNAELEDKSWVYDEDSMQLRLNNTNFCLDSLVSMNPNIGMLVFKCSGALTQRWLISDTRTSASQQIYGHAPINSLSFLDELEDSGRHRLLQRNTALGRY